MDVTISIKDLRGDKIPAENGLDLSNRDFADLWRGLGLEQSWCGSVDARTLAAAVAAAVPERFRIPRSRAVDFLKRLAFIAAKAEQMESLVVWR